MNTHCIGMDNLNWIVPVSFVLARVLGLSVNLFVAFPVPLLIELSVQQRHSPARFVKNL